ncbi:MAG: hypothetical protein AAB512_03905 [Patescibacteria group bacterium]
MSDERRYALSTRDVFPIKLDGQSYSWGATARTLCEKHIAEAKANSQGNFFLVDLCSSYPIFAQILRERRRDEHCYMKAKRVVGVLTNIAEGDMSQLPDDRKMRNIEGLDPEERHNLRKLLSPKAGDIRVLLRAIVTDLLYEPPVEKDSTPDEVKRQHIEQKLLAQIRSRNDYYDVMFELPSLIHRGGNWKILVPHRATKTITERLNAVLDPEKSDAVASDLAMGLSHSLLPDLENHTIVSFDRRSPRDILLDSERSFPDSFKNTYFFRKAGFRDGAHFISDVLKLPFGENSVSAYTSIEGWPYYFGDYGQLTNEHVAMQLASSLKPGGRVIIFPWRISGLKLEQSQLVLSEIEALWEHIGLKVIKETWRKEDLRQGMVDRELVLLYNSPVFKNGDESYVNLVLEKPIESSRADPTE